MDVPVMECFDEDRKALTPLPSTRFDPIRWESGKAGKYGRIGIDPNRYLAGGEWHGRRLPAAVRRDSVPPSRATWSPNTPGSTAGLPARCRIPRW